MARRPYRTATKMTKAQREERAQKMQVQANQGWSQWKIACFHGVLQGTVSKILKRNLLRLEGMTDEEALVYRLAKYEEYREIKENAWLSYLRSMEPSEREEWGYRDSEEPTEMELLKRVREGQSGNPAFLQVILKAMRDENELRGLVKNVTINNTSSATAGVQTVDYKDIMLKVEEARTCKAIEDRMQLPEVAQ